MLARKQEVRRAHEMERMVDEENFEREVGELDKILDNDEEEEMSDEGEESDGGFFSCDM